MDAIWKLVTGDGPLVATAIHDGYELRPDVGANMALDKLGRLREEDPFTGSWTEVAPTNIIGTHSRFQVDLNRPRETAIYIKPEDAWGLIVRREPPPEGTVAKSLAEYDAFYQASEALFRKMTAQHGRIVVYDLHTYNHRRNGPDGDVADPEANPEVNIGTETMNRDLWAPVIDRFIGDLRAFDYMGRHLDVRENVKFKGGNFARHTHTSFPDSVCVLSIEFKKFFMDEWSGAPDTAQVAAIQAALASTTPGVLAALND